VRQPHEALVLVRRGDEWLVLHRTPTFEAYWHVVAGAVEPGETAAEAAVRELAEETGLDAAVVDLERPFEYPLAEESEAVRARFAADVVAVRVDAFLAEAPPGWEPRLNDEHDDYRWCSADEAEALLFWPEPRELLRAAASG
jgi:8-oxo-dGTP pyrophosphatase MutT (NUDIX family)